MVATTFERAPNKNRSRLLRCVFFRSLNNFSLTNSKTKNMMAGLMDRPAVGKTPFQKPKNPCVSKTSREVSKKLFEIFPVTWRLLTTHRGLVKTEVITPASNPVIKFHLGSVST
eukprot:Lithocolla_globosa_v1_NODE_8515_length_812_cov_3.792602.p2 type:complete len:114 gc:universal NODE_8515_length_812_cov_3.792602:616-275(-)